jgi:hypothetical protein
MNIKQFLSGILLTGILSLGVFGETVSGRITSVAVDPSDPSGNTIYAGTANGGVWKTTDGVSYVLQIGLDAVQLLLTR